MRALARSESQYKYWHTKPHRWLDERTALEFQTTPENHAGQHLKPTPCTARPRLLQCRWALHLTPYEARCCGRRLLKTADCKSGRDGASRDQLTSVGRSNRGEPDRVSPCAVELCPQCESFCGMNAAASGLRVRDAGICWSSGQCSVQQQQLPEIVNTTGSGKAAG